MVLDEKRKFLLENLERNYTKIKKWEKYLGAGIKKKIQRIFFLPEIYLPFIVLRLIRPKNLDAKLYGMRKIKIDLKDYYSILLYLFGCLSETQEYKLTRFLVKNLKPTDIFYDIGGNYGFYTYLALEFCKEVHYFDPLPEPFYQLKRNLINCKSAYLNNIALSDKIGKTIMYVHPLLSGESTIIPKVAETLSSCTLIEIYTLTLDEYIKYHSAPTIIKIDAEGAESKVIQGGMNFFKNNSPIIAMEIWNTNDRKELSEEALKKLNELGYTPFYINLEGKLEKVKIHLFEKMKEDNTTHDNFIFKKVKNF
jgi:FkbM family methyltransferase